MPAKISNPRLVHLAVLCGVAFALHGCSDVTVYKVGWPGVPYTEFGGVSARAGDTVHIACPGGCTSDTASVAKGTVLSVETDGEQAMDFIGWGGDCVLSGADPTCSLPVETPRTVYASFFPTNWLEPGQVTVTVDMLGPGTVGQGYAVVADECDASPPRKCFRLDRGRPMTLRASPAGTSVFTGWDGCFGPNIARDRDCTVALFEDLTLTATFDRPELKIRENRVGGGTGGYRCNGSLCVPAGTLFTLNRAGRFPLGDVVEVRALPNGNTAVGPVSAFLRWDECPAVDPADPSLCRVTMSGHQTIAASFDGDFVLTVDKAGSSAEGSIVRTPAPFSPPIDCGPTCTSQDATLPGGTTVDLVALPRPGAVFTWSGCDSTPLGVCRVTMGASDRTVTATFTPPPMPGS